MPIVDDGHDVITEGLQLPLKTGRDRPLVVRDKHLTAIHEELLLATSRRGRADGAKPMLFAFETRPTGRPPNAALDAEAIVVSMAGRHRETPRPCRTFWRLRS